MNTVYRQSPMREAGYTQIDNKIFDAQPFLSPAAFGVLLRMVRMIDGYGNTDKSLSNSFLQETCNISKNTVSKVVNELVDFGFLTAKRQQRKTTIYSLNYENIANFDPKKLGQNLASQNLASQNLTIRFPKFDQDSSQNLGSNKEKERKVIKEKYKEKNNKKEKPAEPDKSKKTNQFVKPSVNQIKNYFSELGRSDSQAIAERFFDYYESNGWKVGRSSMKNWQATCRNWNRNNKQTAAKQNTGNQNTGLNHAINQPANNPANEQPKKSSADIYAENLARDLAQQYPDEFANVPF